MFVYTIKVVKKIVMVFSIFKSWFGKRKNKSPLRTSHLAGTNSSYSIDDQGFESGRLTRYGIYN